MGAGSVKFLLLVHLFALGGAEVCYNATGDIENGKLECTEFYDDFLLVCYVFCNPGFRSERSSHIMCDSPRRRYDEYDDYGYRNEAPGEKKTLPFEGRWRPPIDEIKCIARTSCDDMDGWEYAPSQGKTTCTFEGDTEYCLRTCLFPYVPTEPEFVKEHCGPETQFEWSHYLRHKKNKMPPCEMPAVCSEPPAFDHGHWVCQEETWANTSICQLECDNGYHLANRSEVFCGPSSVYRWSHEWPGKAIGCRKSPLTVEVTASGPCDELTDEETSQIRQNILQRFRSRKPQLWKEISNHMSCVLEDDDTQKVHFLMEIQDLCDGGTCKVACDILEVDEGTKQCYELCKNDFMNKGDMLNQMRKDILHYIASSLEETDVHSAFPDGYTFDGFNVSMGDIEYTARRDPYGPGSDFCPSPK